MRSVPPDYTNARLDAIDARAQDMFFMSLAERSFRNMVEFHADVLRYIETNNRFHVWITQKEKLRFTRMGVIRFDRHNRRVRPFVTDEALAVLRELEKKEGKISN